MGIQSVSSQIGSSAAPPVPVAQGSGGSAPAVAVVAQAQPQQAPDTATQSVRLADAIKEIEIAVQAKANNLQFSVDDTTGRTIVTVVDSTTGNTIRQLPSEEVLAIARSIEQMKGFLLRESA